MDHVRVGRERPIAVGDLRPEEDDFVDPCQRREVGRSRVVRDQHVRDRRCSSVIVVWPVRSSARGEPSRAHMYCASGFSLATPVISTKTSGSSSSWRASR